MRLIPLPLLTTALLQSPTKPSTPSLPKNKHIFDAPAPYALPEAALATLEADGLVVIDGWLPADHVEALRNDVHALRASDQFIRSKVGTRSLDAVSNSSRARTRSR